MQHALYNHSLHHRWGTCRFSHRKESKEHSTNKQRRAAEISPQLVAVAPAQALKRLSDLDSTALCADDACMRWGTRHPIGNIVQTRQAKRASCGGLSQRVLLVLKSFLCKAALYSFKIRHWCLSGTHEQECFSARAIIRQAQQQAEPTPCRARTIQCQPSSERRGWRRPFRIVGRTFAPGSTYII